MTPHPWMARQESCSLLANDFGNGVCGFFPFQRNQPCFDITYFITAACDACSGSNPNLLYSDYVRENGCGNPRPAPASLPVGTSALPSWALVMATATPTPVTFNLAEASAIASSLAPPPQLQQPSQPQSQTHPITTDRPPPPTTLPPQEKSNNNNNAPGAATTITITSTPQPTAVKGLGTQPQPSPPASGSALADSEPEGSQTNTGITASTSNSIPTSASSSLAGAVSNLSVQSSTGTTPAAGGTSRTGTPGANDDPNHTHLSSSSLSKPDFPGGAIAGIVLGIAALILLAAFCLLQARRRRRKAVERFSALKLKEGWAHRERQHAHEHDDDGDSFQAGTDDIVPLGDPSTTSTAGFAGVGSGIMISGMRVANAGASSMDLVMGMPTNLNQPSILDATTPTTAAVRVLEPLRANAIWQTPVDEKRFPIDIAPDNVNSPVVATADMGSDPAIVSHRREQNPTVVELRSSWFSSSFSDAASEPLPQYFEEEGTWRV